MDTVRDLLTYAEDLEAQLTALERYVLQLEWQLGLRGERDTEERPNVYRTT